jgi:hypothetical protein
VQTASLVGVVLNLHLIVEVAFVKQLIALDHIRALLSLRLPAPPLLRLLPIAARRQDAVPRDRRSEDH